jgi:hypothetical protein
VRCVQNGFLTDENSGFVMVEETRRELHPKPAGVQFWLIYEPEYVPMDPENAPSIVLPIIILIAVLAACGILALVMAVVTGLVML